MKKIFLIILLFAGIKSFGQEMVTEEKSSSWLRISAPVTAPKSTVKKKATTAKTVAKKKTSPPKTTPAVVPKKEDEFNKTNSKVKRFQKN